MKNKRTFLFAGILAAFLMLAVPFAIVSFDADDVDAAEPTYAGTDDFWKGFTGDENSTIKLTEDIKVSSTVELGAGSKTLDLNGYTITYTGEKSLFLRVDDTECSLKIIGIEDGSEIDTKVRVVDTVNNSVYPKNFTLTVEGGTYSGSYVFLLYSDYGPSGINVDYTGNVHASFSDVTINADIAAVWCGVGGFDTVSMDNCVITSKEVGIYLGSINSATLTDVTVDSVSTALEVKSGVVDVIGGSYSSNSFDDSTRTIDNSGSGGPVSTIFINNKYLDSADVGETNVSIRGAAIINKDADAGMRPVIVASGTNDGTVTLNWNGDLSKVLAYYVPDVTPVKEIYINDYLVVNNVTDLQYSLNNGVSKIGLASRFMKPEQFNKVIITKSVEIVGFDDIVGLEKIGFQVGFDSESDTKFNGTVSFKGIEIDSGSNRSINVRNVDYLSLSIDDCILSSKTYTINIQMSCNNVSLNIDGSEITGYCAFQTWAKELDAVVTGSVLSGHNPYASGDNSFAAIVVNQYCDADITLVDTSIGIKYVNDTYGFEYAVLYFGESSGTLTLKGTIGVLGESVSKTIRLSEGGSEYYDPNKKYQIFTHSTADIVVDGTVTGLDSLNLPVGSKFTMIPGSVFSGIINGPEDASIEFSNVKAGNDGIVITAGSLSISGSMIPSGIGGITSGTITLSGDDVFISGTVESGVTINVAPGCEPTIVDSLTFKDGSALDFLGTGGKFSEDSGDVYYNAGSNIDGDVKSEDQKINASTGASYEKVTVFLKTNGPMYPDQSSVEVFVGDYYVDTLDNVQFDGPAGYIFEGWYTEFGLKITDLTKANNSITTLVANFVYDPSSAPVSPGAPGTAEPEESSEFDIADHVVLIEAVIAVIVLIGFVAYIRKN